MRAIPSVAIAMLMLAPAVLSAQADDIAIRVEHDHVRSTDTLVVHFENRQGARTGELWIEPASDPVQPKPVGNIQFFSGPSGTVRVPLSGLPAGAYELRVMMLRSESRVDVRQPLTVIGGPAPGASPAAAAASSGPSAAAPAAPIPSGQSPFIPTAAAHMTTSKPTFAADEPITVVWEGFPSAQMEVWYESPDAPLRSTPPAGWLMATGRAGKLDMPPANPGRTYELRYFVLADPTHTPHRAARFTVGGGSMTSVATGHYGCYFDQFPHGIGRSSIQYVEVLPGNRYREPRGSGAYTPDRATATLRMTSGPLAGHVAHYRTGTNGKPALLFERGENDGAGGRPTIDVSATYCYFGQQ
jgi:hypothetical protein